MQRLMLLVALAAAALAALTGSGSAAAPAKFHENFDDTILHDDVCGVHDVTSRFVGVDNFFVIAFDANGNPVTFKDNIEMKQTITATNGKSVVYQAAGQHDGTVITDADGSITFADTFRGLPEQIFTPGGAVLTRDAGLITFYNTFDANGNFVSHSFVEKGPHPENDADFTLFCQVIVSALT